MNALCLVLSAVALSIWDYPSRFPAHERLRRQFVTAVKEGDTATMEETCRKGVQLLPEDPTWRYNLACSLAYFANRQKEALDELERAIDLGYRDSEAMAKDTDLARLSGDPRFKELVEYADYIKLRPIRSGPLSAVETTGVFGRSIVLAEHNLGWDFDFGCFVARMKMTAGDSGRNVGDLYMNRDAMHSAVNAKDFPGLTVVRLDEAGRSRGADRCYPNILFPYPVFGNASLAITQGPYWRSLSRALVTTESCLLNRMAKLYLSNQTWVFPSNADTAPVGTNGDIMTSITPYWLTTAGRSWSDLPYLRAALIASGSLNPQVKESVVSRGLLAPTVQTLIRKSLRGVAGEDGYLTPAAHPSALPRGGVDTNYLTTVARSLTEESVPPIVPIVVAAAPLKEKLAQPEMSYASSFAWAYVLRAEETKREFVIQARGAQEYAFVQTHGTGIDVKVERLRPDTAKVTIDRRGMSPTNRVDIAVCGRNAKTGWGAPSYVCFARMDPSAPYSDPALTVLESPPSPPAPGAKAK